MAPKLVRRKALLTWVYALFAERELDSYVGRCAEELQNGRILRTLQGWKENSKAKKIWRKRMKSTLRFYEHKILRKGLRNWSELLPILRLKREKQEMAKLQYGFSVAKRALQKWKKYRERKHDLGERIRRLKEVHILRHCYEPLVFLRTYSLRKRAQRVSSKTAIDFYVSRTCAKTFRNLLLYALQRSAKRSLNTKARMHYFSKIGYSCLNQLHTYSKSHREKNLKRRKLKKAVSSVDRQILLIWYFEKFRKFVKMEAQSLLEKNSTLRFQKLRRLAQAWLKLQRRENEVKGMKMKLQGDREFRMKRYYLHEWFKIYDLHLREQRWRVRTISHQRQKVLKELGRVTRSRAHCRIQLNKFTECRQVREMRYYFAALHCEWKVRRFRLYRKLKKKLEIQRFGFQSLQIYKNKGLREKALLLQIVSNIQKKEAKKAFFLWSKTVHFVMFVETLRRHTTETRTLSYTHYALYFWAKYTTHQRLKVLRMDHLRARWALLTKRTHFQEWFTRAQPLIAANVIERTTRQSRVVKLKARIFRKWSQWAGRKSVLGELGRVLGKHTDLLLTGRVLKVWRRAALDCSIVRTFCVKHERTLAKKGLFALYQNLNMRVAKSQEIASLRSALQLQEKVGVFMSHLPEIKKGYNKDWAIMVLLKTFRALVDFSNPEQLKLYTLKKWRGLLGLLRYRKMQRKQAQARMENSMKLRFWVRMRNEFINRKKEALLLLTAERARVKLVFSKVWEAWRRITKIGHQLRKIESTREKKIKEQMWKRLQFFQKRAQHINSLRERMMRYLKHRCSKVATRYYQKWRVAYIKEQDLLNRVAEYKRRERLTKLTLSLRQIGDWKGKRIHLREVGEKAKGYFREREIRRMKRKVVYGWKAVHLEGRTNDLEDQYLLQKAIAHREFRLKSECLEMWIQSSVERQSRTRRSQLYSIYSAWKFYTKEHKLLRKYLKESGTEELQFLRSTRREDALGAVMRDVVSMDEGSFYSSLMANSEEGERLGEVAGIQPSVLSGPARQQTTPHSQLRSAVGLSSEGGAIDFQITGSSIQAEGDLNFSSDLID